MRQARLHGEADVRLDQVDIPPLPEDGVLVRIEAAGVCGSDAHMFRGIDPWGALSNLPATFGHESAGTVVERGAQVSEVAVGDLVAIKPMYLYACRSCPDCLAGHTNSCAKLGLWHGQHRGAAGFAEFEVVAARNVQRIERGVPPELAALTDIFGCGVHALHHAPAEAESVAVVGTGPIALSLALTCRNAGKRVTVLGRNQQRLAALAEAGLGLEFAQGDAAGAPVADVAFECVGGEDSQALATAVAAVAPRRWVGVLGAFAGPLAIDYGPALRKEVTFTVLNGYCGDDFAEAARLIGSGQVPAEALISHRYALTDIADALRTVVARPVTARKVMVLA